MDDYIKVPTDDARAILAWLGTMMKELQRYQDDYSALNGHESNITRRTQDHMAEVEQRLRRNMVKVLA